MDASPNLTDDLELMIESQAEGQEPDIEDNLGEEVQKDIVYSILSYGSDLEVELLQRRLEDGTYVIPEFQRGYVWTRKRGSQFIESLLLGLPVPGIFIFRDELKKKLYVLDGHQRLETLRRFYSGVFDEKSPFSLVDVQKSFLGKSYKTLDDEDRKRLNTSVIHATIISQQSPEEYDKSSIYKIFQRINSGSVPLTPHEIRVSINYDTFVALLKEINKDSNWRKLFGPINKRMKDQELILRMFAFWQAGKHYEGSMLSYLDSFLEDNAVLGAGQGEYFSEVFRAASANLQSISEAGEHPFKFSSAVNAALIDSIGVAMLHGVSESRLKDNLGVQIAALKQDDLYKASCTQSTNHQKNVFTRQKMALEFLTTLTSEEILRVVPPETLKD